MYDEDEDLMAGEVLAMAIVVIVLVVIIWVKKLKTVLRWLDGR